MGSNFICKYDWPIKPFICLDREDRRRGYIGRDYGEDDDDIDYTKGM